MFSHIGVNVGQTSWVLTNSEQSCLAGTWAEQPSQVSQQLCFGSEEKYQFFPCLFVVLPSKSLNVFYFLIGCDFLQVHLSARCARCHVADFEDLGLLRVYFYKDPTEIMVQLWAQGNTGKESEQLLSLRRPENTPHWFDQWRRRRKIIRCK